LAPLSGVNPPKRGVYINPLVEGGPNALLVSKGGKPGFTRGGGKTKRRKEGPQIENPGGRTLGGITPERGVGLTHHR